MSTWCLNIEHFPTKSVHHHYFEGRPNKLRLMTFLERRIRETELNDNDSWSCTMYKVALTRLDIVLERQYLTTEYCITLRAIQMEKE